MATHSSSCLENPMDRGAWRATVHRLKELDMTEETSERIDSLGQQPLTLWEVVGNADSLEHWSRSCILTQFPGASWVYSSLGSATLS